MVKTNSFNSVFSKTFLRSIFFLFALTISSSVTLFGQTFNSLDLHSEVDHVQPMTGIVFWAENTGDLSDLGNKTQLEFSYLVYSDVIEQEGVYDWGVVDDLLTTAASRGRQLIVRFRYTYPGETDRSVPLYVTQATDYNAHELQQVEGSNTFIPDWGSTTLEDFTLEFYTKFAERYDNDSRLAFLQMGFGSYSEYHLYDGPDNPLANDYFPSKAFQTTFLNHVNTQFVNTQWTISIDASESSYTPLSSSSALRDLNFGLFDDSFLHEEHSEDDNEYNRASWLVFGENRADNHVAGGELNYYSDYDQENVLKVSTGPWGTSYETLSEMYDITYMIGNDQLIHQTAERIEEAGMANGYHYEVTDFSTDGVTTKVIVKNNGIAPIYYDAYPTVNGVSSTESLKGLIAGESKTFSIATVATGEDLTIECSRTVNGQEIQFDADIESSVVAIKASLEQVGISVFPNPNATNSLSVRNLTENNISVSILSLTGTLVLSESVGEGVSEIDISELIKGVYVVRFGNSSLHVSTSFVKN